MCLRVKVHAANVDLDQLFAECVKLETHTDTHIGGVHSHVVKVDACIQIWDVRNLWQGGKVGTLGFISTIWDLLCAAVIFACCGAFYRFVFGNLFCGH